MRVATAACRSLSVQQSAWFVILVLSPGGIWERESILLPGQGIPAPGHPGRAAETQRENSGGCHLLLLPPRPESQLGCPRSEPGREGLREQKEPESVRRP